jgi:hypothetical protein
MNLASQKQALHATTTTNYYGFLFYFNFFREKLYLLITMLSVCACLYLSVRVNFRISSRILVKLCMNIMLLQPTTTTYF